MTDEIDYTPEQHAEAERIVAAERARREAAAAARRAAYLPPVRQLLATPAWGAVRAALAAIIDGHEPDGLLSVHVEGLHEIAARLSTMVAAAAE